MTSLRDLAEQHRVAIKRRDQELVVGKNGFLCVDDSKLTVVYTDDGRKRPLTQRNKTRVLRILEPYLAGGLWQEGDVEFIARVPDTAFATCLRVLGVKRFTARKGQPSSPETLARLASARASQNRPGTGTRGPS